MNWSSIFARLLLAVLGTVVGLIVVEAGLWLASPVLRTAPAVSVGESDSDEVRILCVGESTTRGFRTDSWPAQLEQILNDRLGRDRFRVINQGVAGIRSPEIASCLPGWVELYRPHIVVAMFGINDSQDHPFIQHLAIDEGAEHPSILVRSRTYRFIRLLLASRNVRVDNSSQSRPVADDSERNSDAGMEGEPVQRIANGGGSDASAADSRSTEKVEQLSDLHAPLEEAEALERIAEVNPSTAHLYRLAWLRINEFDDLEGGLAALRRTIELDPEHLEALLELGGRTREDEYHERALEIDPSRAETYRNYVLNLVSKNENEQALEVLERMCAQPDLEVAGLYEIALYWQTIDSEQARRAWQRLIDNPAATSQHHRAYVMFLVKQDEHSEALTAIRRTIKAFPEDELNRRLLIQLELDHGSSDRALDVARTVVQRQEPHPWMPEEYTLDQRAMTLLVKDYSLARSHRVVEELGYRIEFGHPLTLLSYLEVHEYLDSAGIPLFVMQYPRVSIDPLREIFDGDPNVVFIENVDNFENEFEHCELNDLFTDLFAFKFGHLTDRGNRLIAERVADSVLERLPAHLKVSKLTTPVGGCRQLSFGCAGCFLGAPQLSSTCFRSFVFGSVGERAPLDPDRLRWN